MSKLQEYKKLLLILDNVDTIYNIKDDVHLRGNLAYLVEVYSDSEFWTDMVNRIQELANKNDVNELCWYIYENIYNKYITGRNINIPPEYFESLKTSRNGFYKIYKENKNCRHFKVIHRDDYPKFFISYEYLEDLLK